MLNKFSVLMSLYYAENTEYLDSCFKSLSEQTVEASEIILVIDGPISKELQYVVDIWLILLNIKTVPLKENVGLSKALNIGLKHCSYELVARMDTDDICLRNRFGLQLEYMKNNLSVDICGGYSQDISSDGSFLSIRKVPIEHCDIKKKIWSCPFIHPSVMFRKEKILSIGSYNELAKHRQDDYDLWIRAAFNGLNFANIAEPLICYRVLEQAAKKNTVKVGFNRVMVGLKAVYSFDNHVISYLALFYPLIRAMIPGCLQNSFSAVFSRFDPRRQK
jgi:glycosyltransferase involved in cell wall biosynthesis